MKTMHKFIMASMLFLAFNADSYTVISSKTEVSPGCGGRIEEYDVGSSSFEEWDSSDKFL